MTLGQFACALGTTTKWVQNAWTVLGLEPLYQEAELWRLALTRLLEESLGIPLKKAYAMAGRIDLPVEGGPRELRLVDAGTLAVTVDWSRFATGLMANLSRARTQYQERRRGRPPKERLHGLEAARQMGLDIGLLRHSLKRSPAERLRALDQDLAFLEGLRVQS